MPFLRDEGPPIPAASIQKFRESLPVEYGWAVVNETGREVLVVRVPKARPDYLHDLAEVAFYVGLDTIRGAKDVLLVGHEKAARLEPQLLRDHIRAQAREDATVVDHLRRQLDRQYGHTFVQSPSNHQHTAFAVRVPKESVAQFTADDVNAIRQLVANLRARVLECQYAYIVANLDHERLGRRTLLELIGDAAAQPVSSLTGRSQAVASPAASSPLPSLSPAPARAQAAAPPTPAARLAFPSAMPGVVSAAQAQAQAQGNVAPTPSPLTLPPPAPAAPPVADAPPDAHDTAALRRGLSETAVSEEFEIVSKPRPAAGSAAPPPAATPQRLGLEDATDVHEEYEVLSRARAEPPAAPAAQRQGEAQGLATPAPEGDRHVLREDKEFEVFVSKPKPKADATPSITPPGKAGFQAAIASGAARSGNPAKTKEYEIIGRTTVTTDPSIAQRLRLPSASPSPPASPFAPPTPTPPPPMLAAAFAPPPAFGQAPGSAIFSPSTPIPPRVATPPLPANDSGAAIVARVSPAAPELILAQRFKEAGYEVVEGLRAQGTAFAFAAHRPNGRRVLVKRAEAFGPDDAAALAQLVAALGADVALVVADQVKPGTRLATWGTRLEVVPAADVPTMAF